MVSLLRIACMLRRLAADEAQEPSGGVHSVSSGTVQRVVPTWTLAVR
ncbi:hypothetical protein SMD11_3675 [Streptomyces albireticuli]|uniref:Uncharacterized protein n=1 Tax=Streptomyces albireticuli TaxID=1940 RepID=A0A1Z2L4S9_9ACTN|nr:hypothetical protein SMD11_3675 [Streptomyces albireticuli]